MHLYVEILMAIVRSTDEYGMLIACVIKSTIFFALHLRYDVISLLCAAGTKLAWLRDVCGEQIRAGSQYFL